MRLIEANPDQLPRESRAIAKLARIARCDVQFGGARALVICKRLELMGSTVDYDNVVSAAYSSSTGSAREYLAFECPECGCAHLGEENALACCNGDDWS